MKLQQLKYLLAIVDNGLNITAAADRLYTSQPGVSKQLKLLEEELGLQLFTRKGKSLDRVTRAGEQVVVRARKVMDEVEQIRSVAANYYQQQEGTLTIAATNTQARYILPGVVRELREQYPKVNLNLHQGTAEQVAEMVAKSDIDFAIATGSKNLFDDLLKIPAYHWDRIVLVPRGHELSKMDRAITLDDLATYPLVSYVFSFDNELSMQNAFAKKGLEANIVFTARDAEVIKTYVQMGLGIGIIASMAFDPADHKKLTPIKANGLFPRSTTWLGFRKDMVMRCYMVEFIRLFAPHIDAEQMNRIAKAESQEELDLIFRDIKLPLKNGTCDCLSAAA
ncbi:MAG: LysR substrate-binding domain-containing protein [Woeseiaceae bacterium]|nr:LysR substrate-binding domain-containing protein [Woeseiaceae bacterium]